MFNQGTKYICSTKDYIYYIVLSTEDRDTEKEVNDRQLICKVNKFSQEIEMLPYQAKCLETEGQFLFFCQLNEDYQISCYDENTGKVNKVIKEGVRSFQVLQGQLYYIQDECDGFAVVKEDGAC